MNASTKDDKDHVKVLLDSIKSLEFEHAAKPIIYRVPRNIREINKKAYTPQLVSIGPFHYGKEELADMERQKTRYVKRFLDKITVEVRDEILTFIQTNEKRIRDCYAETSMLKSHEFMMMIICDAIFIIELFRSVRDYQLRVSSRDENNLSIVVPAVLYALELDLLLLENQLPYFVIETIHNLAFGNSTDMLVLSTFFFGRFIFSNSNYSPRNPAPIGIHFTDLLRNALVSNYPIIMSSGLKYKDVPCAVKLHESGLKFKRHRGDGLLDIRFEKRKSLIPCWRVHELQIPHLGVYDETECMLRNIMALEQCNYYPGDTRVCDYVYLIDRLINTEKDVDFLVGKEIISDHLADNASIANMFNKLCLQIHLSEASYGIVCKELKAHYKNPWNHTKGTLKGVYFSNLWKGTATIAAVVLLLLTIIQAICSIMQVV